MSGPFGSGSLQLFSGAGAASSGFYSHLVNQSLRFGGGSSYLDKTFVSGGNQKTWTWSSWVKIGDPSAQKMIFSGGSNTSNLMYIQLRGDSQSNRFDIVWRQGSGTTRSMNSTRQFRDPSAWMHIVVACDTTKSNDLEKIRLYINGSEETSFTGDNRSTIADSSDLAINANSGHAIGTYSLSPSSYFNGYMAEINFVDGIQLTPSSFGQDKAGIWIPKGYTGSYGTTGFHLNFAEAGDLGASSSHTIHDIFGDSSAVATYLFDGSIVDAGGNYNGTTTSVTFADGIVGTQAGVFNGTSSKWEANAHLFGAHATAQNYSLSGWFQVTANYKYMVTDGYAGTGGGYFAILTNGSGRLAVGTGDASGTNSIGISGSETVTDGEWHHFAYTHSVSGGTATGKLWVDGNYAGTDTTTSTIAFSNETGFGWFAYSNGYHACSLDQIRIFNRALTDAEVQQLAGGYGLDASGVGNHFNPVNLQSTDVVLDSPTNFWCTLNPLSSRGTQSEGNLKNVTEGSGYGSAVGSMGHTSGKWYWEVNVNTSSTGDCIGVVDETFDSLNSGSAVGFLLGNGGVDSICYYTNGSRYLNSVNATYGASYTTGDIIGVALNLDDNELTFYKNGVSQGAISHTFSGNYILPAVSDATNSSSAQATFIFNFGQDSSFAGTKTAQGNTDDNSVGDFYYSPPSGFLALCSANLPVPAIDPAKNEKPTQHFNTKLYTGNSSTQSITGVGFQPDWLWLKNRTTDNSHALFDSVRGSGSNGFYNISTNSGNGQTDSTNVTSLDSDGFTLGSNAGTNGNSNSLVSWNWLAGGASPTQTYKVVVVSDGGNKYRFRNSGDTATFAASAVTLDLQEGGTYTFDQSDSTMSSHPMKLSTTSNGSHGGGSTYSTGVTYELDGSTVTESAFVSGFSSATSRKLIITVAASAPTLYYFCHYHSGMGGQVDTNSSFGSSNFDGAIQSVVSANQKAGFSIINWIANGSTNNTLGHGLGGTPDVVIYKNLDTTTANWHVIFNNVDGSEDYFHLNDDAPAVNLSSTYTGIQQATTIHNYGYTNNTPMISYCFRNRDGFSKWGYYVGNSSTEPFVYAGFRPAWVMIKRWQGSDAWWAISDSVRSPVNEVANTLAADQSYSESTLTSDLNMDFLSNGFKIKDTDGYYNATNVRYVFLAFSDQPFKYSNAR